MVKERVVLNRTAEHVKWDMQWYQSSDMWTNNSTVARSFDVSHKYAEKIN